MVDREGAVIDDMLTIHNITTQLQVQTLSESQANLNSSQDENAAKIRHHSEPHPPASILTDPNKKVKIITFQDGVHKDSVILLSAQPNASTSWDSSCCNPPNKRQCRSMSIPNDGELHTRWLQTQARSRLHRPLAVRPNSGGSRTKSHQLPHYRGTQSGRNLPPGWSTSALADSNTPPESPRSRPSSASSGYFDSPLASLSNLNKNRCESLQMLPSMEQNIHDRVDSGLSMRVLSAKSMPSVADSSSQHNPTQQLLLRCQSQPCVIHERRGGTKRRRNDDQRPSINFNKMTETAIGRSVNEPIAANRLSSPLKIRPTARYGQIFPDRVLQTIASSPQDVTYISALPSSSHINTAPMSPESPQPELSPICHNDAVNDSDSGCSTTDEELCDITKKMTNSTNKRVDTCDHKVSPSNASLGCACIYPGESEHDVIFLMEPNQDSELDIDMIENN